MSVRPHWINLFLKPIEISHSLLILDSALIQIFATPESNLFLPKLRIVTFSFIFQFALFVDDTFQIICFSPIYVCGVGGRRIIIGVKKHIWKVEEIQNRNCPRCLRWRARRVTRGKKNGIEAVVPPWHGATGDHSDKHMQQIWQFSTQNVQEWTSNAVQCFGIEHWFNCKSIVYEVNIGQWAWITLKQNTENHYIIDALIA